MDIEAKTGIEVGADRPTQKQYAGMGWKRVECDEYINLDETLFSGQIFHFRKCSDNIYKGVLGDLLIVLRQLGGDVYFLDYHPAVELRVNDFFSVHIQTNLDPAIRKKGLRFLTSDFIPTVFSFICSSNNNVKRITSMVEYLYSKGDPVYDPLEHYAHIDTYTPPPGSASTQSNFTPFTDDTSITYFMAESALSPAGATIQQHATGFFSFPPLERLEDVEQELKSRKFGYRAEYICSAARFLIAHPMDWYSMGYEQARNELMRIKGVGRKVSDCICLISLRHFQAVPIDTHILKYSRRAFMMADLKSLSESAYKKIQGCWLAEYGEYAGIAQLYIFKTYLESGPASNKK